MKAILKPLSAIAMVAGIFALWKDDTNFMIAMFFFSIYFLLLSNESNE